MQARCRTPFFAVLLTGFLLSACSDSAALSPLPPDAAILAFGDSLTSGAGASAGNDYPAVLQELTGHPVINAGIPGETSREGAARLASVLERHDPALVILIHGGNDMLRKLGIEQTRANLAAMIEMAQARGSAVVMMAVPRPGMFLDSAPFYESLAKRRGIPIDTETLPEIYRNLAFKSDPVHPNDRGYRRMAVALYRLLKESGAL